MTWCQSDRHLRILLLHETGPRILRGKRTQPRRTNRLIIPNCNHSALVRGPLADVVTVRFGKVPFLGSVLITPRLRQVIHADQEIPILFLSTPDRHILVPTGNPRNA